MLWLYESDHLRVGYLSRSLEFVVYRDPTGCLTAFCFSPFEVRDDSNPSRDGLSHLNRANSGGAATAIRYSVSLIVPRCSPCAPLFAQNHRRLAGTPWSASPP